MTEEKNHKEYLCFFSVFTLDFFVFVFGGVSCLFLFLFQFSLLFLFFFNFHVGFFFTLIYVFYKTTLKIFSCVRPEKETNKTKYKSFFLKKKAEIKETSLQTNPECQCQCHIIFIRRRLYRLPPMHRHLPSWHHFKLPSPQAKKGASALPRLTSGA